MTQFLLDTNHASPAVTLNHPLRETLLEQLDKGHSFAICVPVIAELLFGIGTLPRSASTLKEWKRIRPYLNCYSVDERDAEVAAELQISLRRRGRQLETVDAFIAAIALRYELTLLTTDKDFSVVPGLSIQNWRTVS